jgi:hypothetical protein
VGYRVEVRRILSYIVTHNGLRPITLLRGNARDPSGGNSAFQGGEGSYYDLLSALKCNA